MLQINTTKPASFSLKSCNLLFNNAMELEVINNNLENGRYYFASTQTHTRAQHHKHKHTHIKNLSYIYEEIVIWRF